VLDQIFTPEQVAKKLQVHHLTVLRLIKAGKLGASKIGRVYRIQEGDILSYLNANRMSSIENI